MTQTKTPLRPLKAIRAMCLLCCHGSKKAVRDCVSDDCPHHHLRMGKNPRRAGIGNLANLRKDNATRSNTPLDSQSSGEVAGGMMG